MAEEEATQENDDEKGGGIKGIIKSLITKATSSKKMMIIVGSGILALFIIIGGLIYFFLINDDSKEGIATEETQEVSDEPAKEKEKIKPQFESVHIFSLKSFFFPIKLKNNEDSEHFLLVTPNFRMSNSNLSGEINKKLPLIREKMYSIFRKEKLKGLIENNIATQERIKKTVRDRVNELLPVGSGVVKEVFFSEFIVK